MKLLFTTLIISTALASTSAIAQNNIELNQIFDTTQIKNIQALALSNHEMKETQGAVIWFAPAIFTGARVALTGFTRHGVNQTISRDAVGVSNKAILNTMNNPTKAYSQISNQTTRYVSPQATVVLNQNGRVVTTWGAPRITVTHR